MLHKGGEEKEVRGERACCLLLVTLLLVIGYCLLLTGYCLLAT